jgi:hypothetical protein
MLIPSAGDTAASCFAWIGLALRCPDRIMLNVDCGTLLLRASFEMLQLFGSCMLGSLFFIFVNPFCFVYELLVSQ